MNIKLLLIFLSISFSSIAQPMVNYDENAIKPYKLPEVLTLNNGKKVKSVEVWENKRRSEILEMYKEEVYGFLPVVELLPAAIEIVEEDSNALNNTAIRKQVAIDYEDDGRKLTMLVLLYLPKGVVSPPIFVGYNFNGNHTTIDDPNVLMTDAWVPNNKEFGIANNKANESSRGKSKSRWPIPYILGQGFGIATIYYGDVDPDKNDFTDGIHPFFYQDGQTKPKDNEWGSIGAWAWGYSRILDYLKTDDDLSQSKFILFGHSRLGKTALWTGALDQRFDIVISNDSGCGGAALFRRKFGETAAIINEHFPHWFNTHFKKYNNKEEDLPIDQHMLIALMAPRPVYIASAEDDQWADPKGEFLSGFYASSVYELYGKISLKDFSFPNVNEPLDSTIGYHIRTGGHDVTLYDWEQYIDFSSRYLNLK